MKKIYLTAAVVAAMSASFVACTNEMDEGLDAPVSSVVEGQSGKVLFSINTGKGVAYTRAVAEDQAIHKLSVFLFDDRGERVQGIRQDYEGSDVTEGKLVVALPSDLMNKTGFKAYLIANQTIGVSAVIGTEAQLLDLITEISPGDVATKGIPMASGPVILNTTTAVVTAEAVMKRTMSSLFVKVTEADLNGTMINAGDFTYTVKKVRTDKGYMLKDEVCTGEVAAEAAWAPKANTNNEELLGYMYQSAGFEVEVTPKENKPGLGSASRTVVVAADKATKRNKKYVVNVLPKVSASGTVDFTVTVQEWDAADGSFNVDWADRYLSLNSTLPTGLELQEGVLTATNLFEPMGLTPNNGVDYGPVKNIFQVGDGLNLFNVELKNLFPLEIIAGRLVTPMGGVPALEDAIGTISVTTEKGGVLAMQQFPMKIIGALVKPKKGFRKEREDGVCVFEHLDGFELQNFQRAAGYLLNVNDMLEVAAGYEIDDVLASLNGDSGTLTGSNGNKIGEYTLNYDYVGGFITFVLPRSVEGDGVMHVRLKNTTDDTFLLRKVVLRFRFMN